MARYIDADKARKHLRVDCLAKYPTTYIDGLLAASEELTSIPTADVVEVVRCKDCKYRKDDGDYITGHYCSRRNVNGGRFCRDNDFCSYGERKTT